MKKNIQEYGISSMFKNFCNETVKNLNSEYGDVDLSIDGLTCNITIPNISDEGQYQKRSGSNAYDLHATLKSSKYEYHTEDVFVEISIRGRSKHEAYDAQEAAEYISLVAKSYEKQNDKYKFSRKKINSPLQEMKIVKTISAKQLKKQLKESRDSFALGQGFGSKPAYESNVDNELDKFKRKFNSKGGFGYGDGFKQMDEAQLVKFIENIVESLRGKTEYHNLKFVDRIGGQYKLAEGQIKTIKKILKSDQSPKAAKRLKKYINENVAPEMHDIYEGYYGLTNEAEAMIPEIKKCFNKNKKATGTVQEAVSMTAEQLDIPMEMVQEMYNKLKEAYETQMESGAIDNMNESLSEIFNRYRGMSEGSMDGLTDEISEMMGYEDDMPEPREPRFNEEDPYGDDMSRYGGGDYGYLSKYGGGSHEDKEYADDHEGEEGLDLYGDSYGSMDDMDMNEGDCLDCEEEFDFEDSEFGEDEFEGGGYKYNPGLKHINYRGDKHSFERPMYMNESALSQSEKKNLVKEATIILAALLQPFKISDCRNYIMFENKIYYSSNGELVSNRVIAENRLLNERERSWGEFGLDAAQGVASVGSMFIPGGGSVVEILNALVYFVRAATTSDEERKGMLYTSGMISLVVSIMPTVFGAAGGMLKGFFIGGAKSFKSSYIAPLSGFLKNLSTYLPKIKIGIDAATKSKWATSILGKKALSIGKWLGEAITRTKSFIGNLLGKVGIKTGISAGGKVSQLAAKKGFETFFKTAKGVISIAPKQAAALIGKLGFKIGQTVTVGGQKYIIKTISAKTNQVTLQTVGASVGGQIYKNVGATAFVNSAIKSNAFKKYAAEVFSNPSAYAVGYKFLGGFLFGKVGNIEGVNVENMPVVDVATQISAEDLNVADYQGDAGSYTTESPVTAVQNALESLGLSVGVHGADGKYGPDTKNAINKFQKNVGIPVTSNIDGTTVVAMAATMVAKGMQAEAKELIDTAVDDSEVNNEATAILNGGGNNTMKSSKLMTLAKGGTNVSKTEPKKGFMDKFLPGMNSTSVDLA